MSKMTVEWHIECRKNRKTTLERFVEERDRLNRHIEIMQREDDFYDYQIAEAKKLGLDGFDRERFRVKRTSATGQGE